MLKLAVMVALSFWSAFAAKEPSRTLTYGRGYGPRTLPAFDKGYLLFTNEPGGIEVWGPDGGLVFQKISTNPPSAHVMSAAVDSDGTGSGRSRILRRSSRTWRRDRYA